MNQTWRIIGWAALVWLGLWAGGCATRGSLPAGENPASREAKASETVALASPIPSVTPDLSYPGPQTTQLFDPLTAYPGIAGFELTTTADFQTQAALPTRTLTPTIVPTRGPLANPLPVPLYFINSRIMQGVHLPQIWRLERDGYTLTQITHEIRGVGDYFDVAADGRLAYISNNNSLIVSDAYGGNRRVLVQGKDQPLTFDDMFASEWFYDKEAIDTPIWSPDRSRIAYYQDGVNLLNLSSGKIIKLVEGQKWIKVMGVDEPENDRASHYLPIDWTPDGKHVVLKVSGYEWATTALVAPVVNSKIVNIETIFDQGNYAGCCDFSFTKDGQMLFSSGSYSTVGLWLIDPGVGKGEILTQGTNLKFGPGPVIMRPVQAPNGRILFFTTRTGFADEWSPILAFVDSKKFPFRVPEDVTFVGEYPGWDGVLWLPDTSGVIIQDGETNLALMEAQTGKVTPLGIQGIELHWGTESEQ